MTSRQGLIRTQSTAWHAVLGLLAATVVSLSSIAAPLAGTAHADDGPARGDQLAADMDRQKPLTDCRFEPLVPAHANVTPTRCPAATASPAATLIGATDGRKPGVISGLAYAGLIGRVTEGTPSQVSGEALDGSKPSIIR